MAGFTIIETLIVLAVAGLILLIVFEAVPALSRSSRNNQRKQDVQLILGAVSHYQLNDSGDFPTDCGPSPQTHCTNAGGGPNPNDYFLQYVQNKFTFYAPNGVPGDPSSGIFSHHQTSTNRVNRGAITDTQGIKIYNYEKCDPNHLGAAIITGAGYSDIVALYALESGNSGMVSQCQQL
jgi:type II secretory pathway pseudopilin PulG